MARLNVLVWLRKVYYRLFGNSHVVTNKHCQSHDSEQVSEQARSAAQKLRRFSFGLAHTLIYYVPRTAKTDANNSLVEPRLKPIAQLSSPEAITRHSNITSYLD